MKVKSEKIVVPADDPFKHDRLSRKDHVKNLTTLLQNITSPTVFAVNGAWGQGKTVFMEMLNACLGEESCQTVFFSAWETDFIEEPLVAFIGEINAQLKEYLGEDEVKQKAWSKAKSATKYLVKRGIPLAVKIGTQGVLDLEKATEGDISKFMATASSELINSYTKEKKEIAIFKENIDKLLKNEDDSRDKLYVLVDELDRCRPTYTIEMLERIKHLFDIEGLVFILAIDKEQLSHSIKAVYGQDFDSVGYLRRFIDIEFQLPTNGIKEFINAQFEYYDFQSFFEKRNDSRDLQYDAFHLKSVTGYMLGRENYSLRQVEQFFSKVNLILRGTVGYEYLHVPLLIFLLVMRESHPEIYNDYIDEGSSPLKAIDYLNSLSPNPGIDNGDDDPRSLIEAFLIAGKIERHKPYQEDFLANHKKVCEDESEQTQRARSYSQHVISVVAGLTRLRPLSISLVVSKIEVLGNFNFD